MLFKNRKGVRHMILMFDNEQIETLKELADVLLNRRRSGANTRNTRFDMWTYFENRFFYVAPHSALNMIKSGDNCGTAACALGHLVYIRKPRRNESWCDFGIRVIAGGDRLKFSKIHDWIFDGHWRNVDGSAVAASMRISYMLDYGIPCREHSDQAQMSKKAVQLYRNAYDIKEIAA